MNPWCTMPLAAWPVSSAFSDKLHARRGAVAEPLLRHEGRAEPPPLGDRQMPDRFAVDDDVAGVRRRAFAGQRGEQFVLAVAGDAGDAENLAALDLERDRFKPRAVRIVRLER